MSRKIKVMHVLYVFELGGIETFVQQLCNNIDREKFEVYLVAMTNENLGQIHLLSEDVNIVSFDIRQGKIKTIYGFFETLNMLISVIKEIQPDIVHTHHEHYVSFFIQLACKLSRCKLASIRTVHSGGVFYASQDSLSDKVKLYIEKLSFRLFDINIVAVAKAVHRNNLKHFGGREKQNIVIYNGVDLNRFDKEKYINVNREDFCFEESSILFVYVSRLNPGKNHEFLIKIWNKVMQQVPNAVLVFAGNGPLIEDLKSLARSHGVHHSVVFLGSIDNVPELLSVVDVGVFPSLFEGMSIALLEKFAMRLPVVASDIEAFRDVANDGIDSFLISVDKEDQFVEKLINLASSKSLRKRIGDKAHDTAVRYSLAKTITGYENYYKDNVVNEISEVVG